MRCRLVQPGILTATVLAITACRGATTQGADATPEVSVRPGVNTAYQNADVVRWVERFEHEGREIYDSRNEIVAACGFRPGDDVADIGAGTGLFEPLLADAVGRTGSIWAVDIVPEFIEHIKERSRVAELDNVRTVLCTERSVELAPDSIDVAFLCDSYHHFEFPRSTMTSIHRALRPSGTVIVIDFEREPGRSSDWVMGHVRAGRDTVIDEIEGFGFELIETIDVGLRDNYVLRFERP